jgi:hypothetical protein
LSFERQNNRCYTKTETYHAYFSLLLSYYNWNDTTFFYIIIKKSPVFNNRYSPGLHIKGPCFTLISLVQR